MAPDADRPTRTLTLALSRTLWGGVSCSWMLWLLKVTEMTFFRFTIRASHVSGVCMAYILTLVGIELFLSTIMTGR